MIEIIVKKESNKSIASDLNGGMVVKIYTTVYRCLVKQAR